MKKPHSGLNSGAKAQPGLTLGHERFAKISEVEGIVLTTTMKRRMVDFDRKGLSAEERRASIIRAHRKG
jgi:hypothetical protein